MILIAADIASDIVASVNLLSICNDYVSCSYIKYSDSKRCKKFWLPNFDDRFCGKVGGSVGGWLDGIYLPLFWGLLTLTPIFVPLLARVVVTCAMLTMCFKIRGRCQCIETVPGRLMIWFEELKHLLWHFPMLQPIRYHNKPNLT